jgi:uncharacterized protein
MMNFRNTLLSLTMTARRLAAVAALMISLLLPQTLWALAVPPNHGRVNDHAGVLSSQACIAIDGMLADLERTDSTQVMVLTVPSLEGDSLEDFALRVFQTWGIGQKGLDNGVLLLIAEKERKIRIEVGYGLESRLTDLKAGRIIGNVIAPEFKQGRFDLGVIAGVSAIIGAVRGEFQAWDKPVDPPTERFLIFKGVIGIVVCIVLLMILVKDNFLSTAAVLGIIVPAAGAIFFDLRIIYILGLCAAGFVAGLLLSLAKRLFRSKDRYRAYRIEWTEDDGGGGFSSGGGSFGSGGSTGGGSSGGGGGSSGGGGASGGW